MAKAGATIVFNDIKQELVDKGLAAYKEAGIDAHGYVCDVTSEEQVNAMVAQIAKDVACPVSYTHLDVYKRQFRTTDFNCYGNCLL